MTTLNIIKSIFITICCLTFLPNITNAGDERGPTGNVRIGIFPFEPFNYIDKNGMAQGFNVDLLRELSKDKDWSLKFVPGTWAEGLERLEKQEIDLMMSVAYSTERSKILDYAYESVAELWGQVFLRPDSASKNISDLEGQRVGVMRKDISGINFINTAKQFGITCNIIEFDSHSEVFRAVKDNKIDAGVAPQHFGLRHAQQFGLAASSIMFSPFSIYFAAKKGSQHELLSLIDTQLARWKSDPASFFYKRQNYWFSSLTTRWIWPEWINYTLISLGFIILIGSFFIITLKISVNRKN